MSSKHFQKQKKLNPAVMRAATEARIKQAMHEARMAGIEYAIIFYTIIMTMVLNDKSGLPEDEIKRILKEIERASDSINKDYMTIPDVIKALKDEGEFTINEKKLLEYYPQLEGYLTPDDEITPTWSNKILQGSQINKSINL